MELVLNRKIYDEAIERVEEVSKSASYLDQFEIRFPEGINTVSTLEICRIIQDSDFDSRVRLMRLCVAGKNVNVKCPNGEEYSCKLGSASDGIDGFDLFRNEPLALTAIADSIYGFILKKSLRPSTARKKAAAQISEK